MKKGKWNKIIIICILTVVVSLGVFLWENVVPHSDSVIIRNGYGKGKKTEDYEVTVAGKTEPIKIEIQEQEYSEKEVKSLFKKVEKELDKTVLGENPSWDHIETNLNLVSELQGYPVEIQWDLSTYSVFDTKGEIINEELDKKGTLVELRGTVFYHEETMVYVRNAMVYPKTRKGMEKIIYAIQQELKQVESETRKKASFELPKTIGNQKLEWKKPRESHWHYVLIAGIVFAAFGVYKEKEKHKEKEKKRREELLREYPSVISKFTMLLSTGTTVKNAWEKIVKNYDVQKEHMGEQRAYEEMKVALCEMQGGVSEAESYERFGKRCGISTYIKFGTLLSQNLRKGSKGISEILRMEAIQSFEMRKSTARRLGEEAGAKLLIPMMGMLVVVLVMIMVPAFLTMQL